MFSWWTFPDFSPGTNFADIGTRSALPPPHFNCGDSSSGLRFNIIISKQAGAPVSQNDISSKTTETGSPLTLCDFYLFAGKSNTTVMAMTVNPDAGLHSPDTFSEGAIYAFRFDLDGDGKEEVAFKMQFKQQFDDETRERQQVFTLRRAEGSHARAGGEGEIIATGALNQTVKTQNQVSAFAGLKPDLFAANKNALSAFLQAINDGQYAPDAFHAHDNTYAGRNVMAIVVEVPGELIGKGQVQSWATISEGAPFRQIARRGLPLLTDIFISDKEARRQYNESGPGEDMTKFGESIDRFIARTTELTGLTTSPSDYAKKISDRILPSTLPYVVGSPAAFTLAQFNGRALNDNVFDTMLDLATNTTISDGVTQDKSRMQLEFPYFGKPYTVFDSTEKA
jgi:hypothetical protein